MSHENTASSGSDISGGPASGFDGQIIMTDGGRHFGKQPSQNSGILVTGETGFNPSNQDQGLHVGFLEFESDVEEILIDNHDTVWSNQNE